MFLFDVFPPELIVIGLKSADKDEVFEELVDKFCQERNNPNRDEILKSLWERESKMSTGIHKGIAIPHGKSGAIESVCGVLGISENGIEYDALDGEPVYIVFMLLAPQTDSEDRLRILKQLAEFLGNNDFYSDLLVQKDPQSANRIIKKYEDMSLA